MVEYLLSLDQVDPKACTGISADGTTPEGNTGLHFAALHDTPDIARLLIKYQCPLDIQDSEVCAMVSLSGSYEFTYSQGNTALHIARRKVSIDVAEIIKNAGANFLKNKV